MRRPALVPVVLAVLALVLSCGGDLSDGAIRGGEPPAPAELSPPDVTLDRGFTAIRGVREFSDGRLLVADRTENELYLVDFATGGVETVGRKGEGPGEYQRVGWMYPLAGDTTLLTDSGNDRRWHLIAGAAFVESLSAARPVIQKIGADFHGTSAAGTALASDGVLWDESVPVKIGTYQADSIALLLVPDAVRRETAFRMDTIATIGGPGLEGACSPGGVAVRVGAGAPPSTPPPPRCNRVAGAEDALLFPDGWIAVAMRRPYRVDWRTPEGRWIRGAALPDASHPFTTADRCAANQRFPWGGAEPCEAETIESPAWPETLPPFVGSSDRRAAAAPYTSTLFATPDGSLVVRRTPRAGQPHRYDIVDRRGALVRILTLPVNEAVVGFGAASAYTIRTDDVDLQWLRRHPWR